MTMTIYDDDDYDKYDDYERLRLVEVINFAQATYWRMGKSCVTYDDVDDFN